MWYTELPRGWQLVCKLVVSMKILSDLMSIYVLPVHVSVIQVIMFIRAHHKWKENVCKLKLHIMIFFFFFTVKIFQVCLLPCGYFGQNNFSIANLIWFLYHPCVFGVFLFLICTFGLSGAEPIYQSSFDHLLLRILLSYFQMSLPR